MKCPFFSIPNCLFLKYAAAAYYCPDDLECSKREKCFLLLNKLTSVGALVLSV